MFVERIAAERLSPPPARWLSRRPTHSGDVNRRLEILRRCGKISAGRTAAAVRDARKALSAEFNSEAQHRSCQMVPHSMNGAYSDGGSHEFFAISLPDVMY